MKLKKIFLSLTVSSTIAIPLATVIACSNQDENKDIQEKLNTLASSSKVAKDVTVAEITKKLKEIKGFDKVTGVSKEVDSKDSSILKIKFKKNADAKEQTFSVVGFKKVEDKE